MKKFGGVRAAGAAIRSRVGMPGMAVVAVLALTLGSAASVAQAQPHGPPPPLDGGAGPMSISMFGGRPEGVGRMFGGRPEGVGRMADRLLDGLGATDAQRAQIRQIAMSAATDLRADRDAGRDLRERGLKALTAPTLDAGAVETVRQQMLAAQDRTSRRTAQAMLEIARVLTPEQRALVAQRLGQRQAVMRDRAARMQRDRASAPR